MFNTSTIRVMAIIRLISMYIEVRHALFIILVSLNIGKTSSFIIM